MKNIGILKGSKKLLRALQIFLTREIPKALNSRASKGCINKKPISPRSKPPMPERRN